MGGRRNVDRRGRAGAWGCWTAESWGEFRIGRTEKGRKRREKHGGALLERHVGMSRTKSSDERRSVAFSPCSHPPQGVRAARHTEFDLATGPPPATGRAERNGLLSHALGLVVAMGFAQARGRGPVNRLRQDRMECESSEFWGGCLGPRRDWDNRVISRPPDAVRSHSSI